MKKIILVLLSFAVFCAFTSIAIAQTANTQTPSATNNTTTTCGNGICEGNEGITHQECTTSQNPVCYAVKNCPSDCSGGSGGTSQTATCPTGCICNGGLTACPTINKPVTTQVSASSSQATPETKTTSGVSQPVQPTVTMSTISLEKTATGKSVVKSGNTQAVSSEKVKVVENKLYIETSDSKNEEVKIMPSTASETAIERLGEVKNVQIELKEVGKASEKKPAYEFKAEKSVKVLGLFPANVKVSAEVNAQTGSITSVKKPWWSFFAW